MTMLIITYCSDAFSFIPETREDKYMKMGYASLMNWQELPLLNRALTRSRRQMARIGVEVEAPCEI